MAKSELNTYGPVGTSWSSLKALDADKTPMPNQGMKAIAAICGQAAAMGSNFQPVGLGNIVAGNNAVMMPPAHQISGMNGAALAGLALAGGALALASSGSSKPKPATDEKSDVPTAPTTETPGAATATTDGPVLGPVPEPPTKAPPDPAVYSGFEEPDMGEGTKIVLGGDYGPKGVEIPPIVMKAVPKKSAS